MSSTKDAIRYSSKINSMARKIRSFISSISDAEILGRIYRAIENFCYGYSPEFRSEFLTDIGITETEIKPIDLSNDSALEETFTETLCNLDGECVFLLKDTAKFFSEYQKRTGKGVGIEINRKFLGGEDVYFDLVDTTYKSLSLDENLDTFLERYVHNLKEVFLNDPVLYEKSKTVYDYVKDKSKIIWIDTGFQFTINLFCYGSVKIHSDNQISQDIYNFTVCPWLATLFKGKYLTTKNELGLGIESRSSALST